MVDIKQLLEDKDTIRLAIVALLTALNFGVLEYYKDQKFDTITFGSILKVSAGVFVSFALLIFVLYVITLGISKSYKKVNVNEIHPFLYDLGIALTALIVFMTLTIALGIISSKLFNNNVLFFYLSLGIGVIGGYKILTKILDQYIQVLFPKMKEIKLPDIDYKFYIGLVLTILSIFLAFYLSSPIDLKVWEKISDDNHFIEIYAKNNDFFRGTGIVYFYRLGLDHDKPLFQLPFSGQGDELGPREELLIINMSISPNKRLIRIPLDIFRYNKDSGDYREDGKFGDKLFYSSQHEALAYKITCTNCMSQGIIRIIPSYKNLPEYIEKMGVANEAEIIVNISYFNWSDYHYAQDGTLITT